MKLETVLPHSERIDTSIAEYFPQMCEEVESLVTERGDIIDPDLEWFFLGLSANFDATAGFITDRIYKGEPKMKPAIYRATMFGYQTANVLQGDDVNTDFRYLFEYFEQDDPLQAYIDEASQYLSDNPHTSAFITYHIDQISPIDIDPSRKYADSAELAAAVVIMLAERAAAERYVREAADSATTQDFITSSDEADEL